MARSPLFIRIGGSVFAGAVGFLVGFYLGFFLVLSIWGLDFHKVAFVAVTGGLGTILAAVAIAFTVSTGRRAAAFLTAIPLGVVLVLLVVAFDFDPLGMAVGGVVLVTITAVAARRGGLAPFSAETSGIGQLVLASRNGRFHSTAPQGGAPFAYRRNARAQDDVRAGGEEWVRVAIRRC